MIGTQANHRPAPSLQPAFNYDAHIKELNDKFGRLVKQLGANNKAGSTRHEVEVEFSYALNELKNCPTYLQGKRFDQASAIVASLITSLKKVQDEKSTA
jgi:hypothetical protein